MFEQMLTRRDALMASGGVLAALGLRMPLPGSLGRKETVPAPPFPRIESASWDEARKYGESIEFETDPHLGDEARLYRDTGDSNIVRGPIAKLEAAAHVVQITQQDLKYGRVIARLTFDV